MTIFGHSEVHVTKDPDGKCWVVSTAKHPRQHLVTIPWTAIFQTFTEAQSKTYTDYIEAIATCQSHPNTSLTREEEREVRRWMDALVAPKVDVSAPAGKESAPPKKENVIYADFKKRKK